MNPKTIKENNRLIAEFLGWEKHGETTAFRVPNLYPIYAQEDERQTGWMKDYPENFEFHERWDWLMPVVEKIERSLPDGSVVVITHKTCEIPVPDESFDIVANGETKLEATYKSVSEFIKCYNQQSK